jgi:hypothetical protein
MGMELVVKIELRGNWTSQVRLPSQILTNPQCYPSSSAHFAARFLSLWSYWFALLWRV